MKESEPSSAEHQSQYDVFGMVPRDTELSKQNLLVTDESFTENFSLLAGKGGYYCKVVASSRKESSKAAAT